MIKCAHESMDDSKREFFDPHGIYWEKIHDKISVKSKKLARNEGAPNIDIWQG